MLNNAGQNLLASGIMARNATYTTTNVAMTHTVGSFTNRASTLPAGINTKLWKHNTTSEYFPQYSTAPSKRSASIDRHSMAMVPPNVESRKDV